MGQTVPNDPEPMTSSRVIRLRAISYLSSATYNVSMSCSSPTSVTLKHRNTENYFKFKPQIIAYFILTCEHMIGQKNYIKQLKGEMNVNDGKSAFKGASHNL